MAEPGNGMVNAASDGPESSPSRTAGPETAGHPAGSPSLLSLRGIGKSFSGVTVLKDVSFDLAPGEVHILAGENGAGKSTLIKIIAGIYTEYEGEMRLGGRPVAVASPHHAAELGISVIHQEMSLVDSMSAADNLFLGRELASYGGLWLDQSSQRAKAREFCSKLDLDIDLSQPVEEFPLSVKNRIEIAKALAIKAKIIIMDEPTSALSGPEVKKLFGIIAELKKSGCGIVYITHRMDEIYSIADRITVLRDGRYVGTAPAKDLGEDELVKWMIGRELKAQFPERVKITDPVAPAERFRVEGFSVPKPDSDASAAQRWLAKNISFSVKPGEILGFAGLQGSGNSDLFSGLFGVYGAEPQGRVTLDGKPFQVKSPKRSIDQGMAYLTNDRKGTGLVLGMDIVQNITLASLPSVTPAGWFRPVLEREAARRNMHALRIKASSGRQEVGTLSGGNQQKVALAKWLETGPKVMLLDEPTRGVDIGAKHEIYKHLNDWTAKGIAILLITSEMPELLGLADRIMVMHRGVVTAEFRREDATQEGILRAAMGRTA